MMIISRTTRVKKVLIIIIILVTVAFAFFVLHKLNPIIYKQRDSLYSSYSETKDTKEIENTITLYLEQKNKDAYGSSPDSKFFCVSKVVWQQNNSEAERVVYAKNSCAYAKVMDKNLRGDGGGSDPPLFKLQKVANKWKVIDSDNRTISPNEPITQDWVKIAESVVPKNIKSSCFSNCFSTEGLIDKVANFYNIKLPKYPLNECKNNNDCDSDSVCVLKGTYNTPDQNTCVKKCEKISDCGFAHTCNYQCVNGENGCPETAKKICLPDMFTSDLVLDPDSFVGFDDLNIPRRQAIQEAYPVFVVDYEKQPCFAGCSVKVVEKNRDYYYAYITHSSGLPIGLVTCFRIDPMMKVYKIGEFPDPADSYIGYTDINPVTCRGIK